MNRSGARTFRGGELSLISLTRQVCLSWKAMRMFAEWLRLAGTRLNTIEKSNQEGLNGGSGIYPTASTGKYRKSRDRRSSGGRTWRTRSRRPCRDIRRFSNPARISAHRHTAEMIKRSIWLRQIQKQSKKAALPIWFLGLYRGSTRRVCPWATYRQHINLSLQRVKRSAPGHAASSPQNLKGKRDGLASWRSYCSKRTWIWSCRTTLATNSMVC